MSTADEQHALALLMAAGWTPSVYEKAWRAAATPAQLLDDHGVCYCSECLESRWASR